MKSMFIVCATIAVLCAMVFPNRMTRAQERSGPVSLDSLRGSNRVLVVYQPASQSGKRELHRKLWDSPSVRAGERERELVRIEFTDFKAQPEIARRLELREGQFALALIGKDGNVAFRTGEPVDPTSIFAQIDGMPMRREEMKARGQKPAKP